MSRLGLGEDGSRLVRPFGRMGHAYRLGKGSFILFRTMAYISYISIFLVLLLNFLFIREVTGYWNIISRWDALAAVFCAIWWLGALSVALSGTLAEQSFPVDPRPSENGSDLRKVYRYILLSSVGFLSLLFLAAFFGQVVINKRGMSLQELSLLPVILFGIIAVFRK